MRRLLFAACLAVCLHAVLFLVDLPWAQPARPAPRSRTVDIELVALHKPKKEPASQEPEGVIKAPDPEPRPQPKPKPVVKAKALPKPVAKVVAPTRALPEPPAPIPISPPGGNKAIETPTPVEEAAPSQPEPKSAAPESEDRRGAVDDQAEVRASEPLYHLNPPPSYPRVARRRNYQGTVVLDVLVTVDGAAADVRVATSSGYAILDRSALNAVKTWRFTPARKGRQPVEMWVQVPVRFELH